MKSNYIKSFLTSMLFLLLAYTVVGQSDLKDSKYATVINNYLSSSNKTAKFANADLEDLYVNKELFSEKTKVANVYLNQRYKGVKIFNAISSVAIKNDKVFHFADRFETNITDKINTGKESVTALQAVSKLANYFNLGSVGNLEVIEEANNKVLFTKGDVSQERISVEKVYFQDKEGTLKLSWDLNILTIDGKHWWSARVDAISGKILNVNDWILTCNFGDTNHSNHNHSNSLKKSFNLFEISSRNSMVDGSQYNVLALPADTPDDGVVQLISEPANLVASPFGWHDDDGIAGAEYTTTQGNNVIAALDTDVNNGNGYMPNGGTTLNFNFPVDFNTQQPADYQDAAVTNLFYMNNMMHDIFYNYGFDIRTGAFQDNHYARINAAGIGDPVIADGQDSGGINNANFGTPPDGASPRMQMYLWNEFTTLPLKINNGSLAGEYDGSPATAFGDPYPDEFPITSDVVLVEDDDSGGSSTDPNDACDMITNGGELAGKIAILRRGTCEFGFKVLSAENDGAIAVIIVNNEAGPANVNMQPGADGASVTIPSIIISQELGEAIIDELNNSNIVNITMAQTVDLKDGDFANGVIAHEYGHGISNRLTGGADNVDCLENPEQMGEGWSDWFGYMITLKETDAPDGPRNMFNYIRPGGTSFGRRAPYSTDFSVNNYTYNATNDNTNFGTETDPFILNEVVHYIGFIWATVLWDLSWAYIDKYGFDSNLYTGNGGNNKVMQIVMDGLKLQPCSPGMIDGRDAILAADMALTGGEDQCMIWEVFATRGFGFNASQGTTESINDQTEDFTTPDPSDPSLANCTTLSSETFNSNDFRIYPNPTSDKFTIKSTRSLGDVTLELIDINGREIMSKKATLIGEVELNLKSLSPGLYILKIKGEYINASEKIIKK